MKNYSEKRLNRIIRNCKTAGIRISLVNTSRLHDYAAMNPAAAKPMGFKKIGHNEILIDKNMNERKKLTSARHELIEFHLMRDLGLNYMQAHRIALQGEKKESKWER